MSNHTISREIENFDHEEQERCHDIITYMNDPNRVKGCALHDGMTRLERKAHLLQPEQLTLPEPAAKSNDQSTSVAAANDARKKCSENQMRALLLLAKKPMTDYELADATGMQQNSIGKRRGDLYKIGLVEPETDDAGNQVKRPGPTGSTCLSWRITQSGRDYLSVARSNTL